MRLYREEVRIYAYREPIDMRCSFNGLISATKRVTIEEQARSLQHYETAVSFVTRSRELEQKASQLEQQLSWFKTQLFGQKSERRFADSDPRQIALGELLSGERKELEKQTVSGHVRNKLAPKDEEETKVPLIDPSIPLREVVMLPPEVKDLEPSEDETPVKAGIKEKGKLKTGYFWVVYGELEEVFFEFHSSRALIALREVIYEPGLPPVPYMLTDGYVVYDKYSEDNPELVHANCWSHTRREFIKAEKLEPEQVIEALNQIRQLYQIEEEIRDNHLDGNKKLLYREEREKPLVEKFFEWCELTLNSKLLLPTSPLTKALYYALKRKPQLMVYLSNPEIAIDTNHLERQIRPIPMGRKNWLFCWTEIGAKHVATIQTLLQTCRLQNIDPCTYLVDVLQRVQEHPASKVDELIPRNWKILFADKPLRSQLL